MQEKHRSEVSRYGEPRRPRPVEEETHNGIVRNVGIALQGVTIGALIFLAAVLVLAAISAKVDTLFVQHKVADAIRASQIQYPGRWDIIDTCII
jgi:hypothetical protein